MPRSLAFCAGQIVENLDYLSEEYSDRRPSHDMADRLAARLKGRDIHSIIEEGLHDVLGTIISDVGALGAQIEKDYRFNY